MQDMKIVSPARASERIITYLSFRMSRNKFSTNNIE